MTYFLVLHDERKGETEHYYLTKKSAYAFARKIQSEGISYSVLERKMEGYTTYWRYIRNWHDGMESADKSVSEWLTDDYWEGDDSFLESWGMDNSPYEKYL